MPSIERQQRDAENRALRQWADREGIDLPPTGRIPAEIRAQFADAGGVDALAAAGELPADDVPPGPVPSGFAFMPPPPSDVPPPPGSSDGAPRATSPSSTRKKSSGLAGLQSDIAGGFQLIGGATMYVSPIAGRCMIDDADPVSVEIIRLGEQYPKFGEFLIEAAKIAPPLKLAKYGGRWIIAAAVDQGRVAVDSMPARVFGVEAVAQDLVDKGVIVVSDEPPPRKGHEPADTAAAA